MTTISSTIAEMRGLLARIAATENERVSVKIEARVDFNTAAQANLPALLDALERRTEALRWTLDQVRELMAFHDSKKKPCGEYGVECPIAMGEWFDKLERDAFEVARSALEEKAP